MLRATLVPVLAALALAGTAAAAGSPQIAAVQHALRGKGVYTGAIDGVVSSETTEAVRRFQTRAGLLADGVVGPQTTRALGLVPFGSRLLAAGATGSDVLQLQFLLAWHGFPNAVLNGTFNGHVDKALRKFQEWAELEPDGIAGPTTFAALRGPAPRSPIALAWPLEGQLGDLFGPRGVRFHSGIDIAAPSGVPVAAAGAGRVTYAGYLSGGWGLLVTIDHGSGVRAMYAHLSGVDVKVGDRVEVGEQIGLVGATGDATGPHLHFEVRLRGAAVDPLTALS